VQYVLDYWSMTQASLSELSFEQAISELEQIVRQLEQGDISLEQSIAHYTRGTALKSHCQHLLQQAKLQVEQIMASPSGDITTVPFATTS
jgi:exodeoxyribonuclease VII small subunit